MKDLDDKALVRKCIEGSAAAWDTFVERYARYVHSVVFKTLRAGRWPAKQEDAEDILGQVFLSFLENDYQLLRNFEWRCSLKTWIWIVARKMVIRYFRRKQHKTVSMTEMTDPDGEGGEALLPADEGPDPAEVAEMSERVELLKGVLADLPERERLALVYYFYDGASYAEIAELLNIKPHYVGTIIFRAKKLLEGRMAGRIGEGLET